MVPEPSRGKFAVSDQPESAATSAQGASEAAAPQGGKPDTPPQVPAASSAASGEASAESTSAPQATKPKKEAEDTQSLEQRKFPPPTGQKRWYVIKVQTNREDAVKEAILRRAKQKGLDHLFGEILVPTETTVEYKGSKKRYKKQKLYPGYIIINMEVTDESWFLVREVPGVGDFTGAAGHPVPMSEEEVEQLLARVRPRQRDEEKAKQVIDVKVGDRVKIKEGTFFNFEGEVESVDPTTGRVTVMINIFGRSTPVEVKHYQLEVL